MVNEFDSKAREWDKNQIHIERSEAIARAFLKAIPLKRKLKALEFGAGTGLLSFLLKDKFSGIVLMDNSAEMINVIRGKIKGQNIRHMKPVLINLEHEDYAGEFEIIYNQMVFHHVDDIETILRKFHNMLVPGGFLVIADLYHEDGSFHGEGFTGHKGFDVDWLSGRIRDAGFTNISHQQCYAIKKTSETGQVKEYPVFLITASR